MYVLSKLSSCLHFPSAGITGFHSYTWFVQCWEGTEGFMNGALTLYQLGQMPRPLRKLEKTFLCAGETAQR